MVAVPLVEAHAGRDLRETHPQHVRVVQQHRQDKCAAQEPIQLRQDALRGDIRQQRRLSPQRGGGGRFDGEAQHGGKPQRPQNPQGVLLKAAFRVAHTAQDAVLQILPPAEQVGDMPPHVHRHGVHRQIPAAQVVLQCIGKSHRVRAAVIGVRAVGAEGGDLKGHSLRPDGDGAVAQPRGDGIAAEQGEHLLRPGGGGHVPVGGHAPQQRVADAAAHGAGGKPRPLQRLQHVFYRLRHHAPAPFRRLSRPARILRQKSRLHRRGNRIIIIR